MKIENISGLKRTAYCGQFRAEHIGQTVTVFGWVQRRRDLGQLIFIDLRDRTGLLQLAFDDNTDREVFEKAFAVRSEYVLAAIGTVRERSSKNKDIPTGEIEIEVKELRILGVSETPPFEILANSKAGEDVRLKHRYLDLRRPDLQANMIMRHNIAKTTREYFYGNGFIEIETPILMRSTPEGARDYLVPSRIHKGNFYALPQSPQLYKQLSMVAGFDRYIQLARCFRDEDLRADRQPEFTQIDMEMSFVDVEDVLAMGEGYIQKLFKDVLNVEVPMPLPRLTYTDAMNKYGSDKPDTRYGMEICDLTNVVKDSEFVVFKNAIAGGGSVRAITAKNCVDKLTRKEVDKLTEYVKGIGGKGIAWIRRTKDADSSSFAKFMTADEMTAIYEKTGAQKGDVVLIIADTNNSHVLTQLGSLRTTVAKKLDIIPEGFNFLWVVEFPFFEHDEETNQWVAMHHAFTSPMDECLEYLETDKGAVKAKAYDLVLNGTELCSGSIRITNPELQSRMFDLLGITQEDAGKKFGFLLEAFKYGAPPHGGMGIGLDRLAMIMSNCDSLKDVVAFPKVQNASELMTMAPGDVDQIQLDELGIKLV
ncbi:MAG: aspartate--tRNA ligase [Clostridia bacterium]